MLFRIKISETHSKPVQDEGPFIIDSTRNTIRIEYVKASNINQVADKVPNCNIHNIIEIQLVSKILRD